MVFRGTYENGKVILDGDVSLPNGTRVDVQPSRSRKAPAKLTRAKSAKRSARPKKKLPFSALLGIWKDRPQWEGKSSVEVAAELRREAMGNRYGQPRRR